MFNWSFSFWLGGRNHWGWRRDRWDAGSVAVPFAVLTYLRHHYHKPKTSRIAASIGCFVALASLLVGCSMFGTSPSAPTKTESLLYNTTTNYVPVVVPSYVTNQVTITAVTTNTVGVIQYVTNTVPVTVAPQTNQVPQYTETLKPGATGAIQGVGGVLNVLFPGVGSIITNGVLALLGAWGYARSSKLGNTTSALTQEIEVARNLLQSIPGQGSALDAAFVNFIQSHQADAGVLQQVMTTIAAEVSNKDASTAASQIAQTVAALTSATAPPPPTTPVPAAPKV